MLPRTEDGFVIGPDGFAESSADILADWFAEHGDDPDEGDPETWPDEYDSIRVTIGPAVCPDPFAPLPPDVDIDEILF